jgi:predicted nucleotidyltransferase
MARPVATLAYNEPMTRVHRLDHECRDEILARLARELAKRPDVVFAYGFGSFLQSDAFRDIDVGVWMREGANRFADLELAVTLSRAADFPVDVRLANHAPLSFLFHILRGRLLIVNDEPLLAGLIERTARLYHDQAPLVRQSTRDAFAA